MENSTPNPEHHQHHAHHSLEDNNQKPPSKRSIEFSSPLAQPPVASSPPAHLKGDGRKDPLEPELKGEVLQSVPLDGLKHRSEYVVCPKCQVRARTITREKSGNTTHAVALGVAISTIGLWLAWVPYFINRLKNVFHHCGNCRLLLAEYHPGPWSYTEVLAFPIVRTGVDDN
ncbi:litaf zinc finger [Fusarium pseudoanthophilum]|uniref:Litaf zinc finger n=1 Tax=Fusarium pseudoanthophilum TaxID=48495 RepID=A0A8H5ULM1_9HYPO|nr:litaf zinc finger [Fusarium pseudoanthophilum]